MIEMGYVGTSEGLIHYRTSGDEFPVVLLHWASASGRMYEGVMPALADSGFKPIALDLPGYGRSHRDGFGWPIERYADNILEAIAKLNIDKFHLLGGHVGSSIAVEIALKASDRVDGLILDGTLLFEPDEWAEMMAPFVGLSPTLSSETARVFPFELATRVLKVWNPDFELTDNTLNKIYEFLNDALEAGIEHLHAFADPSSAPARPVYPLRDRFKELNHRTLILSADREPLRPAFNRALEHVSGSEGYTFKGVHPLLSGRHLEYAMVVTEFFG